MIFGSLRRNSVLIALFFLFISRQESHAQTAIKYSNELSYSGEVLVHTTPFGETFAANLGWFQNIGTVSFGKKHSFQIGLSFTHDNEPSATKTLDLQTHSNLEARLKYGLGEMFYKLQLPKINFQIGQQDISSQFLITENGSLFSSSSFGIDPAMTVNMNMPTFPFTSFALTSEISISENFLLKAGIFNANFEMRDQYLVKTWSFDKDRGLIFILEPEFRLLNSKVVTRFGTYHHGGLFEEKGTNNITRGLWGFYNITDIELFARGNKSFNFFYQINSATNNLSELDFYFGSGIRAINMIGIKQENELGLAFAHASVNAQYPDLITDYNTESETLVELSWLINFSDHFSLQPYTQMIFRKDTGNETNTPFIFSLRAHLSF